MPRCHFFSRAWASAYALCAVCVFSPATVGLAQLATFVPTGATQPAGEGCFELNPAANAASSAVWATDPIDLEQPFHVQAIASFGTVDGGADGMVFVLQTLGPEALGSASSTLGFAGFETSFGVEFDTSFDPEDGDIPQDHIALISDGNVQHSPLSATGIAGPVSAIPSGETNLEDGEEHLLEMAWNPATHEVVVSVDCEPRLTASVDLQEDIFHGSRWVWWGFTGSTGGSQNIQTVCLAPNALGTDTHVQTCPEAAVQLVAGGIGVSSYAWSPSNVVSDATVFDPVYTGVTSNTLVVEYTDQCGNLRSEVVDVDVDAMDVAIAGDADALNCLNGGELTLEVASNFGTAASYVWTLNNAVVGEGPTLTLNETGTLELHAVMPGTTSLQCQSTDQRVVVADTVAVPASAGLSGTLTCAEPTLELVAEVPPLEAASFAWTTEDGQLLSGSDGPVAVAGAAGTYMLTLTNDQNGCQSSDAVTVQGDFQAPEVTVGELDGALSCAVQAVRLEGTHVGPDTHTPLFSWSGPNGPLGQSTVAEPAFDTPGAYTLTVEFLENGCLTHVAQPVLVEADPSLDVDFEEVVLPNVLTPDNDAFGQNEKLVPFIPGNEQTNVLALMDTYHLTVFNRWGQVAFQNNGRPLQWDGRVAGEPLAAGTYVAVVSYTTHCGGGQSGELKTTLEVVLR